MEENRRAGRRMAFASCSNALLALFRVATLACAFTFAFTFTSILHPGLAQTASPKAGGAQFPLNPTVPISTFEQPILVNAALAQKSESIPWTFVVSK